MDDLWTFTVLVLISLVVLAYIESRHHDPVVDTLESETTLKPEAHPAAIPAVKFPAHVIHAITALQDPSGSSMSALTQYLVPYLNGVYDENKIKLYLRMSLKRMVANGRLIKNGALYSVA
jgi:hypothetical protein